MATDTSVEVDSAVEITPPDTTYTIEILQLLKETQQQHGLRHGDYQRYRGYCSRRLRRMRKSLKFLQGRRGKPKFVKREITEEIITDVRFLYLPLIHAERAWGHAMQLKQEANTEPRKRFHLTARLCKAVKYAEELEVLSQSSKCDARSKLEAQAYHAWMRGTLLFEREKWQDCIEAFTTAKTIYEKLAGALNEEQRAIYAQRVEEIAPNIRYCAYNIGDESAINDLMQMRVKSGGEMSSNLDILLAQTREKQAATLSEVTWRGRTVPVKSEQIRGFFLSVQESDKEVAAAEDVESKISVYESLLMGCKDALQILRDELKTDANFKQRTQRAESQVSGLQYLYTYVMYIRHTKTIERNMLLAESLKENLVGSPTFTENRKVTKPQDLIRIYDIILQSLGELPTLPGLENDEDIQLEVEAKTLKGKAFRCFYLAQSYASVKKWRETSALYERVVTYITEAEETFKKIRTKPTKADLDELKELLETVKGLKYSAHASSILDSELPTASLANLEISDSCPLLERLEKYQEEESISVKNPNLVTFPPDFQPTPQKPVFFDIALNHVEFPSLDEKQEQNKGAGGIGGFLRGWWGGNK
ncbi:signal recognition particle subunit SRP68-like [Anneissia japonica]|uniref:signal recognition particle subunit SRP68-like n=1 Tax=Anneissia japonica TaxID=1529436 RepID=UPI001425A1EA|nr:signal recognition particle subunit SRP68-like [Anneissia japonica]